MSATNGSRKVETMDIIQANYDVYAKYVSQFTTYSVKDLKEIAARMNISGRSTMKKGELASAIAIQVLSWSEEAFSENTYVCMICNKRVMLTDQPDHMNKNHTLHSDVPTVIDTPEFPMDHQQFVSWYNRRGGIESFDGFSAIEADHKEALEMNAEESITVAGVTFTGIKAVILKEHFRNVERYNPELTRDKNGMVRLTAKQRRRVQKKTRSLARKLGFLEV